jgi:hypothetical protein
MLAAADSGARSGAAGTIGAVGVNVQWCGRAFDDLPRDYHLLDFLEARQIEHDIEQDAPRAPFGRSPRAPLRRVSSQRSPSRTTAGIVQRVLGLRQDLLERGFIEIIERHHDREATNEFRDQPVIQQVFGLDVAEHLAGSTVLRQDHPGRETDRCRSSGRGDDLLETREGAIAAYDGPS